MNSRWRTVYGVFGQLYKGLLQLGVGRDGHLWVLWFLTLAPVCAAVLKNTNIKAIHRAPDRVRFFSYIIPISSPNPMFDHLLESSHRDDSN